jgi:hypothetical protein
MCEKEDGFSFSVFFLLTKIIKQKSERKRTTTTTNKIKL